MFTGGLTTGASSALTQPTAQNTSNGTDWAGSISSFLGGIGSIGSAAGSTYNSIDKAFDGVPVQPQGSTSNVTVSTGGQKAANGSNILLYGAGFLLVGMLGILAFKK